MRLFLRISSGQISRQVRKTYQSYNKLENKCYILYEQF